VQLCGGGWDIMTAKRELFDSRYLASMWTIRLFNRCCDICKDFRVEILEINCETVEKVQKWQF